MFLMNRGKTDICVGTEKLFNNQLYLVIDKMIVALASVTQTGFGSRCLCMLNFKDVVLGNIEGLYGTE